MSCSLEHDQTYREQRRRDFVKTYDKEPTDEQLQVFIEYIESVKNFGW